MNSRLSLKKISPVRREKIVYLLIVFGLSAACASSCVPRPSQQDALLSERNKENEARGHWSDDQISAIANAAEKPIVNTLISVMNRQLGKEAMLSPARRELMIKSLDRVASLIETNKSLVDLSGSKEWLEQSQIERVLQYLPRQKQFQAPDGEGGTVPIKLEWGIGLISHRLQPAKHAAFYPVIKAWLLQILERMRQNESKGYFRSIPLRFDPGNVDAAQNGMDTAVTSIHVIEDHLKLMEAIDPLEGTEYSFHYEDNLFGKKDHIYLYQKAALFSELQGGKQTDSVLYTEDKQRKRILNAPVTCATYLANSSMTTKAVQDVLSEPVPLLAQLSKAKGREVYQIGDFSEQQFCVGIIEHMLAVLHSN